MLFDYTLGWQFFLHNNQLYGHSTTNLYTSQSVKTCQQLGRHLQYNTIQSNLFQLSYMSIIIIIHCIFLNEKSKRICRKLNKLIRDIPRITHRYIMNNI